MTSRKDARWVAYELLRLVDAEDAYANLALPALLRRHRLDERAAAFATELAFGTLRLQGRYDAVIAACSDRPLERLDPGVLALLRLGTHQLLALAVPTYAAVSATVDVARSELGRGPSSFVNAVLRRVSQRTWPQWAPLVVPDAATDEAGHWSVAESHPRWIVTELHKALAAGGRADELPALLAADNRPGHVTCVARPGRMSRDELLAQTGGEPGRWSPWAVRVTGDPGRFAAVRTGRAGVQDEGSQLVPLVLSRAPVTGADEAWLDMCAGPGGKTAALAGRAEAAGVSLTAVEQHPHRAELVRRAVAGGPPVEVVTGDARSLAAAGPRFSRVLLDAPCTGLGAMRRRPELRWRRTAADLPGLRALQSELLRTAAEVVVPGGLVAYVTCSPVLAETDDIVALALRHTGLEPMPAAEFLPEVPDAPAGAALRLWPHRHDTDGMFVALLRRP